MQINKTTQLNEIMADEGYSLYLKSDKPLTRDSYFFKQLYGPKNLTLTAVKKIYAEIRDEEIEKLPAVLNEEE